MLNKKLYFIFGIFVALYLYLNFGTPTNPNILERYKMDAFEYQAMRASIALPIIAVWFTAFYGFSKLINYARKIKKSSDGEGFMWIALGLGVLAIGLPVNSIIALMASRSVALGWIEQSVATIISTHAAVGYQLLATVLLAMGALKLLKVLKEAKFPVGGVAVGVLVLTIISVIYIYNAFNNPSREVPVAPATTATYYMNDFLMMTTIVIPYIIAWALGIFSFIALYTYLRNIKGILYRRALIKFDIGLFIIILMSVVQQFLTVAVAARFAWQLGSAAVLVQLLVLIIGLGYAYVALGSKELMRLEDTK